MLNQATSGEVQNFVGVHPTRPADLEEGETEGKTRNSQFWLCCKLTPLVGDPKP